MWGAAGEAELQTAAPGVPAGRPLGCIYLNFQPPDKQGARLFVEGLVCVEAAGSRYTNRRILSRKSSFQKAERCFAWTRASSVIRSVTRTKIGVGLRTNWLPEGSFL